MADDKMGSASALDGAYAGNRLLDTFPADLRERLVGAAELIHLADGELVLRPGVNVERTIFPIGATTISLNAELENGRSIEVASVGSEGAIGGIVSCGNSRAFARAEVLVGGRALAMPMAFLDEAKAHSGHLRNLFCRYADYLLAQILQSVACNAFHSIDNRSARWLLTAQDRAGDTLALTQEAMAGLLGVQRTTLNAVVRQFQDEGIIAIRRGSIEVLNRDKLKARSCNCYDSVERHFGEILGATGTGGSEGCD